jgi:ribonuclease/clavin/mitogillin
MREAVSAIFVAGEKIFSIKRQNFLAVFPGYHAFPGGKVDKKDNEKPELAGKKLLGDHSSHLMNALCREIEEELNFNLRDAIDNDEIVSICELGIATTPEFNPYRFETHFYKITLKSECDFDVDQNEVVDSNWTKASELLDRYYLGEILAVPPTIKLIEALGENIEHNQLIDLNLQYDTSNEVPMIESLYGVRQFLPLSNTFPPANRTNSFIIGDSLENRVLIDPSPKNKEELNKFINSIEKVGFSSIFLTHHHPDHHEYAPDLGRKFNIPLKMGEDTHQRILKKWGDNYFDDLEIIIVKEGDVLTTSLGQEVSLYAVPGHDEGQLALAPKSMNWFLAGDLFQTIGTVVIGGDEGDMGKYFDSLQKVIDLKPAFIIPSHGIAMGGTYKLEKTLEHRKQRESQIAELHDEGKNIDQMLEIIYSGLEPRLNKYALATIKAHLKKLNLPF